MRRIAAVLIIVSPIVVPAAQSADRLAFPSWDMETYCRAQANYSFAATLGDSSVERVLADCEEREGGAKARAAALWSTTGQKDDATCLDLADGKYSWLARCLDGGRTRVAR